ncbi:MAG: hypothetical protein JRL30_19095 [Deltaproteobacteria bacterium]|nr:hypothetical protein [Deltaproteobacteria bacterium]
MQIQGRFTDGTDKGEGQLFKTVRVDPAISQLLETYNVSFKGEVESTFLRDLLSWVVPVFLFVGIWYFFIKRTGQSAVSACGGRQGRQRGCCSGHRRIPLCLRSRFQSRFQRD